ncbi:GNAT family N-acetyltransferase [Anaerocolumna sp. MB42-C2]|uniref:GNAT family N-acetyltransferase n=1 Tax=Anaerocolumna sp. MB42-C2 TaxID=3070997 RepID=UPI003FA40918
MFIKEEYRGCGIFKLLLDMVEQHANQCGDHTLHLSTRLHLNLQLRCTGILDFLKHFAMDFM